MTVIYLVSIFLSHRRWESLNVTSCTILSLWQFNCKLVITNSLITRKGDCSWHFDWWRWPPEVPGWALGQLHVSLSRERRVLFCPGVPPFFQLESHMPATVRGIKTLIFFLRSIHYLQGMALKNFLNQSKPIIQATKV